MLFNKFGQISQISQIKGSLLDSTRSREVGCSGSGTGSCGESCSTTANCICSCNVLSFAAKTNCSTPAVDNAKIEACGGPVPQR